MNIKKLNNLIEYSILAFIAIVGFSTYFATSTRAHQAYVTSVNLELDANSDEFVLLYNQFWQQFNSSAVRTADYNSDGIISQTEISMHKKQFLTTFNFSLDSNGIFILDNNGKPVDPNKLPCFLKNFNNTPPNAKASC